MSILKSHSGNIEAFSILRKFLVHWVSLSCMFSSAYIKIICQLHLISMNRMFAGILMKSPIISDVTIFQTCPWAIFTNYFISSGGNFKITSVFQRKPLVLSNSSRFDVWLWGCFQRCCDASGNALGELPRSQLSSE